MELEEMVEWFKHSGYLDGRIKLMIDNWEDGVFDSEMENRLRLLIQRYLDRALDI